MKRLFIIFLLCFLSKGLFSQSLNASDSTLFDFWVGTWNLTWKNGDGTE